MQHAYRIDDVGGVELSAQACAASDGVEALAERISPDGEAVETRAGPKAHPGLRDTGRPRFHRADFGAVGPQCGDDERWVGRATDGEAIVPLTEPHPPSPPWPAEPRAGDDFVVRAEERWAETFATKKNTGQTSNS